MDRWMDGWLDGRTVEVRQDLQRDSLRRFWFAGSAGWVWPGLRTHVTGSGLKRPLDYIRWNEGVHLQHYVAFVVTRGKQGGCGWAAAEAGLSKSRILMASHFLHYVTAAHERKGGHVKNSYPAAFSWLILKMSLFQNKILFVGGGWWGVLSCGFTVSTTHCTESRLCSTDDASRCKPCFAAVFRRDAVKKGKVAARTFASRVWVCKRSAPL